jgi:replicative superfamily II helicase
MKHDLCYLVFRFHTFNTVQSSIFHTVYNTDENVVVSAPTSSGKTVAFELAVLRMCSQKSNEPFLKRMKACYIAPIK